MNPEDRGWRLRVFKRDGTWRIRITVSGEPWGAVPMLFASFAEAWAVVDELVGGAA
jgi:hypothetical protein